MGLGWVCLNTSGSPSTRRLPPTWRPPNPADRRRVPREEVQPACEAAAVTTALPPRQRRPASANDLRADALDTAAPRRAAVQAAEWPWFLLAGERQGLGGVSATA